MNLLLLDPAEVGSDGHVELRERRAEHLLRVLAVEPGQLVRAGLVGGPVGTAEILTTSKRGLTLRFLSRPNEQDSAPVSAPAGEVDLIVGLPRPQVLHRVLQTASAMAVRRLDLVNAWRVEKSFFQSPSVSDDKIRYHLLLGAEQGMSTRLPEVQLQPLLLPFLHIPSQGDGGEPPLRLVAHPEAGSCLEEEVWNGCAVSSDRSVQIAIGPEGGWIDRELDSFREAGFAPVRLGAWILRVEVAVAVALGQLAAARRWSGGRCGHAEGP
ncbi:MAG: 16S rRNA (uracil(1498)-N(3))-methyltransferase [Thermoanaerobaculia bacterium]|nr:16S rRNA (uracil(1498)-N(3))-methyltransferase [Thermoanaerobaculia bacterium]